MGGAILPIKEIEDGSFDPSAGLLGTGPFELVEKFSQSQASSKARTGQSRRLIVIHEAGMDDSVVWPHA